MSDEKKVTNNYSLLGGFPVQICLLVLHYGNILKMPLWLVWLPSIIAGCIIIIGLIVIIIIAILER